MRLRPRWLGQLSNVRRYPSCLIQSTVTVTICLVYNRLSYEAWGETEFHDDKNFHHCCRIACRWNLAGNRTGPAHGWLPAGGGRCGWQSHNESRSRLYRVQDAQWKDRETADHKGPRSHDGLGADGDGLRRLSRQLLTARAAAPKMQERRRRLHSDFRHASSLDRLLSLRVAHDVVVWRYFGRRRSGIWPQTKAAPKQQSRRRRLGANGFALTPDAVIREGNGAVELAVGESPLLVSPSCVEKGRRLQSDPRSSKRQRVVLWPHGTAGDGCPGSVSVPSDLPELGLLAGSTARILSH